MINISPSPFHHIANYAVPKEIEIPISTPPESPPVPPNTPTEVKHEY